MKLDCYLLDRHCGVLDIDNDHFRFQYLDSYLQSGGPALSVSLQEECYREESLVLSRASKVFDQSYRILKKALA